MDEFFAFVDAEQTFNPYTDHAEELFHKSISHTKGTLGHADSASEHAQKQRAINLGLPSRSEIGIAPLSSKDTLPDDILIHIFVLVSQGYGPVTFPFRPLHIRPLHIRPLHIRPLRIRKREIPFQLVLSHVCSRWRILALHTFELWNKICLINPDGGRIGLPYHEWFLRAGTSPIELSLHFRNPSTARITQDNAEDDITIASIVQDIVSPLTIKMLHLNVTLVQLKALSSIPNPILPHIENLELTFRDLDETFSRPPASFTRIRSVTLRGMSNLFGSMDSDILQNISLPWNQLQCLILAFPITNVPPLIYTLRRMPLLQDLHLHLSLYHMDPLGFEFEELVVPSLRRIQLEVRARGYTEDVNMILRNFTFPALIQLDMAVERWTDDIYEIIKRQYNGQGLEELSFPIYAPPVLVSSILKDMPKLRALRLRQDIMDDDAITGLSNGTLGCHLRELIIYYDCYIDQWLSMVETRKRTVDKLIETGCNWREMITVLKNVEIFGNDREWYRRGYKERVDALGKAGITVKLPRAYVRW